ncbi:MAG: tetratricopeptide repeat protein [Candidatus Hodarchaeales archaeon]
MAMAGRKCLLRCFYSTLLVFCCFGPAFASGHRVKSDDTVERAVECLYRGDYGSAEKLLRRAVETNPKSDLAHGYLGILYIELYGQQLVLSDPQQNKERYDKAIRHFKKAMEINPDSAMSHFAKGVVRGYQQKGENWEEAQKEFETALKIDPKLLPARYYLAMILGLSNEELAVDHVVEIIKRIPESSFAVNAFGDTLGIERRRVLSRLSKEVRAILAREFYRRGVEYVEKGKSGLMHFSEAVELKPDFAEAINMYGLSLVHGNRHAITMRGDDKVVREYGKLDKGAVPTLAKEFKKAIYVKPDFVDALYNLGELYYDTDDFEKAYVVFKRVRELGAKYKDVQELYNSITVKGETLSLEDILRIDAEVLEELKPKLAIPDVLHIAGDQNQIYVGTWGDGLYIFDGLRWRPFNIGNTNLPGDYVTALETDGIGNVWFGLAKKDTIKRSGCVIFQTYAALGLVRYDGRRFSILTRKDVAFPSNGIVDLASDHKGKLWALVSPNDSGMTILEDKFIGLPNTKLFQYDQKSWKALGTPDDIRGIDVDRKGNLWAISKSMIFKFVNGAWNGIPFKDEDRSLLEICAEEDRTLVVSTHGDDMHGANKVHVYEKGKWDAYKIHPYNIFDLIVDRDGHVWVCSEDGVSYYKDGEWHYHERFDAKHAIYLDKEKNIWVGKCSGEFEAGKLEKFNYKEWIYFSSMSGEDVGRVRHIKESLTAEERQKPSIQVIKPDFKLAKEVESRLKTLEYVIHSYSFKYDGTLPNDLKDVSSFFLKGIPKDPFTEGEDFRYIKGTEAKELVTSYHANVQKEISYILYSIGPDRIDHEGKVLYGEASNTRGDIMLFSDLVYSNKGRIKTGSAPSTN